MKSKCSFILKAGLSLVLVLLLLFSTMATGIAAVVDDLAETGSANISRVLFLGIPKSWSANNGADPQTVLHTYTKGGSGTDRTLTFTGMESNDTNNWIYATTSFTTNTNSFGARRNDNGWYSDDSKSIDDYNIVYIWYSGGAQTSYTTYQMTSTASLSPASDSITTAQTTQLTPELTSNANYNEIMSTSYEVTSNPGDAGHVTSDGVFSATAANTYTVTATVTYNAIGYTSVTKTTTATASITVTAVPNAATSVSVSPTTPEGTITQDESVTFTASAVSPVGGASYKFFVDGIEQVTVGNSFSYTFSELGDHTVRAAVVAEDYTPVYSSTLTYTVENTTTIYVLKSLLTDHGYTHAHYWSDVADITTWPGVAISSTWSSDSTNRYYSYTLSNNSTRSWIKIKFHNNSGTESGNSGEIATGKSYLIDEFEDGAPKAVEGLPTPYYTVTFSANSHGSLAFDSASVASGGTVTAPTATPASGWSFNGWKDGSGTAWVSDETIVTADITVYAQWLPVYTVTFDDDSFGFDAPASQSIVSGGTVSEPADPVVAGYTFNGWYTETAGGGTKWNFATSTVTANTTLYPNFIANPYDVTLAADGAHGTVTSSDMHWNAGLSKLEGIVVSDYLNISVTPAANYLFDHWAVTTGTATIADASSASTTITKVTADTTVTAYFKGMVALEGMLFYLYDTASTHLTDVTITFADDASGTNTAAAATSKITYGQNAQILHYAEVPSESSYQYNYVKFDGIINKGTEDQATKSSGWLQITNASDIVCTYDGTSGTNGFTGLGVSTKGYNASAHIYFDDTVTDWNPSGDDDTIYFVIGRSGYVDVVPMTVVANTNNKLFYCVIGSDSNWENYTFFGFAKKGDSAPSGGYQSLDDFLSSANVGAYTTFVSYYDLSKYNGTTKKSFIGFGLETSTDYEKNKPIASLDFLWIRDTSIDGTGDVNSSLDGGAPANEGKYLNRGVSITVNSTAGNVKVDGYKADGDNQVSAISQLTVPVGFQTHYFARNSTVTISGIIAPVGYSIGTVTVTGAEYTYNSEAHTLVFTVPGGTDRGADDSGYAPIQVLVTYVGDTKDVAIINSYSVDGSSYTNGNTGGTLTVVDTTNDNAAVTTTAPFGDSLSLTAAAAANYSVEGIYYRTSVDDGANWSAWTKLDADLTKDTGASASRVTSAVATLTVDDYKYEFKAQFVAYNLVTISEGDATLDDAYVSMNNMSTKSYGFVAGTPVTLDFGNLARNAGIYTVTGLDGVVAYTKSGHKVTFTMPNSAVTISALSTSVFDAKVLINSEYKEKLDIVGLPETSAYFAGDDVGTIVISGSNDYASASTLSAMTATIGEVSVTLDADHLSANIGELGFAYDSAAHKVTITGTIGGNLSLVPTLVTNYNITITDAVVSDVLEGATRLKDTFTHAGQTIRVGSVTVTVDPSGTKDFEGKTPLTPDLDEDYISSFPAGSSIRLVFNYGSVTVDVDEENQETYSSGDYYYFIGWFEGNSSGAIKFLSDKLEFDYTLSASTYVYAMVTRDLFIGGQHEVLNTESTDWENGHIRMEYDGEIGMFKFDTTFTGTYDTTYYFRFFDGASGYGDTMYHLNAGKYPNVSGNYGITLTRQNSDNHNCALTLSEAQVEAGTTRNITIYFDPKARVVYAVPTNQYKTLYLSEGHTDDFGALFINVEGYSKSDYTPSITVGFSGANFTTENFYHLDEEDVPYVIDETNSSEQWSKIIKTASGDLTVTVSAEITTPVAENAANFVITNFVIYNLDTGDYCTTEAATRVGESNVYTANITIDANKLVIPVLELSDAGETLAGVANSTYTVKVHAGGIKKSQWGGLFAMYIAATTSNHTTWPGQVMVPDGKDTFSAKIYNEGVTAVLFTNYNSNNMLATYARAYNYPNAAQTYDYAEPVILINSGENNTLTFELKQNNDGYHGDYYEAIGDARNNASNASAYYLYPCGSSSLTDHETVKGTAYSYGGNSLTHDYKFVYLKDGSGNRMSLNGKSVDSAAGYYVVCVGGFNYQHGLPVTTPATDGSVDNNYGGSLNYSGKNSVEWFIYDSNFRYLGHYLSASVYDHVDSSPNTYLVDCILNDPDLDVMGANKPSLADLDTKSVMISYEAANTRYGVGYSNPTTRFSGQWIKVSNNKDITASVSVAVLDSCGNITVADSNVHASYGAAYIGSASGSVTFDSASVKMSVGKIYLDVDESANANGAVFVGWYDSKNAEVPFSTSTGVVEKSFSEDDTVFYAVYQVPGYYQFTYPSRSGADESVVVTRYLNQSEIDGYSGNNNTPMTPSFIWNADSLKLYNYVNPLPAIAVESVGNVSVYKKTVCWNNLGATSKPTSITPVTATKTTTLAADVQIAKYSFHYRYVDSSDSPTEGTVSNIEFGKIITFNPVYTGDEYQIVGNGQIPEYSNGKKFSYWSMDPAGNKILTKIRNFGMILTGDFADENGVVHAYAQYGHAAPEQSWNPMIEGATQSRTVTTTTDKLVADYLANYFNYDGVIIRDLAESGNVHYGIVIVEADAANAGYFDTDAKMKTIVDRMTGRSNGITYNAAYTDAEKHGVAYRFDYTDANHISSFNRALFSFKKTYPNTAKNYVAMAYVIFGENIYYSALNNDVTVG